MKYVRNKKIAIRITCFIILLSILFGAHSSLTKLRREALDVFYYGEEANGKGIESDLEYIADQCHNLTVVAGRYMDKEDERIAEVLEKQDLLESALTPADKFQRNEELIEAAMSLYEELSDIELQERDQYYRDSSAVNIKSRQLIIAHSTYNEGAIIFNKCLKQFPANILSKIVFVKSLELFE